MKILGFMQKIPGGMLNVPMLVTALVNTFWPQALQIGGATTALFATGTMTVIGMMLFITGTQLRLSEVPDTLRRGAVLVLAKIAIAAIGAALVLQLLPPSGIWGLSTIALVTALAATNPGIYLAICNAQGDAVDRSAFGLLNLISVPALPMMLMGAGAGEGLDAMVLVQALVPFLAGLLVGNLDRDLAGFFRPGTAVLLPFLGVCFGAAIDLRLLITAWDTGLLLTGLFILVNTPVLLLVDRKLLRRPGHAALGVGTAAGISIAVPGLYAANHPAFAPLAGVAAAQIAMVVLVTSTLMPICARRLARWPLPRRRASPPAGQTLQD